MRCHVLLFAALAEAVGTGRIELELADGATVGEALAKLAAAHRPIADLAGSLAVAVNERYCPANRPLRDGDTLALIPPVSGG